MIKFENLTDREKEIMASAFMCGWTEGKHFGYAEVDDVLGHEYYDEEDINENLKACERGWKLQDAIDEFCKNNEAFCNNQWCYVIRNMLFNK